MRPVLSRWPVELIGRNSVTPSTTPSTTASPACRDFDAEWTALPVAADAPRVEPASSSSVTRRPKEKRRARVTRVGCYAPRGIGPALRQLQSGRPATRTDVTTMALDLASMEPAVLEAIDAIRPALQSDGGDIVF